MLTGYQYETIRLRLRERDPRPDCAVEPRPRSRPRKAERGLSNGGGDLSPSSRYFAGRVRRRATSFTAIAERWGFWSDGCGELLPFCPECVRRAFAADASSRRVPLVHRRRA